MKDMISSPMVLGKDINRLYETTKTLPNTVLLSNMVHTHYKSYLETNRGKSLRKRNSNAGRCKLYVIRVTPLNTLETVFVLVLSRV